MQVNLTSITVSTSYPESMLRFYTLLGLQFEQIENSKGGEIHRTNLNGVEFTIFVTSRIGKTLVPNLHLAFRVPHIESLLPKLYEIEGVMNVLDPTRVDQGKKAIVLDPDGHSVEIIEV